MKFLLYLGANESLNDSLTDAISVYFPFDVYIFNKLHALRFISEAI